MANVDQYDCELMRATWRSVPSEYKRKHPDIASRVWLSPDGPTVGISRRDGSYTFTHDGETHYFDKLVEAENEAARLLATDHDMLGEW